MKNKFQVSESELEVLKVLWKTNPSTSSQIVNSLTQTTDWKPKTIQTLINRLVSKEHIKVDKTNKKAYTYYANITEEEYKKYANESFLQKLYNGSINLMISTFIKDKELSKEDIQDLKKMLEEE